MLGRLLAICARLLAATWRVERPAWPVEGPCVAAFLHADLIPMIALHRGMVGIVSASRDGALAAAALRHFGHDVVRGSSSRGGVAALRGARTALAAGRRVGITVDGPRGPAGVEKPGARALAAAAGVPLVFGEIEAPGLRLPTWDRMRVPWPFARVRVRYAVSRPSAGPP